MRLPPSPERSPGDLRLAPPAFGSSPAMKLPGAYAFEPPPYLDERLVEPETREEMVRGRRLHAAPANPEHADEHTEVTTVVRTHAAPGYTVSTDLLTRTGPRSDFATDTCIRRSGIDPRTGSRYLEEFAFEIVNEQSMRHMTERADELTACGVRRLIAIFVKKGELCEWSPEGRRWIPLDLDDSLDDPTLVRPVPLRALFDAAAADDSLVDALISKNNPRLAEVRAQGVSEGEQRGEQRGLKRGRIEAIETACELLAVALGPRERAQMHALDAAALDTLLCRIKAERGWP